MTNKKDYLATFSKEGRILVPKAMRKLLDIREGDQVILKIENGAIKLSPKKSYFKNLQKTLATKTKKDSLVADLLAMRKDDRE